MSALVTVLQRAASSGFLRGSPAGAYLSARTAQWQIDAQKLEEAEAILAAAIAIHPRDPDLAAVHAQAAHARGQHREAADRWEQARRLGAKEPFATSRLAASLRLAGETAAARTLIDDALTRSPNDFRLLSEAARLAHDRNDPHAAVDFWRRAMLRARPHADWLQGYAQSLLLTGDLDQAARVVDSARRRHPAYYGLIATAGSIATARQDWAQAVALWAEYRRHAPDDTSSWEGLGHALFGARMGEIAGEAPLAAIQAQVATVDDEPMRRLVLRFESIGDNCELGLVQRRYGAEPLGLLRWNDVRLDDLVAALDHGFEGVGEPENTAMVTIATGELYVMDRRWHLAMHTFLRADRVDADEVYKKMCRRIVYLRDKLVEDIRTADKIFVFRADALDAGGLHRLHAALRTIGHVTLLGVKPVLTHATAFPGRAVGTVEQLGDGLYIGFLERPAVPDIHGNCIIDFDGWTGLLAQVHEMARNHPTAVASPDPGAASPARAEVA